MKKKYVIIGIVVICLYCCANGNVSRSVGRTKVDQYVWPNENNTGPSGILKRYAGTIMTDHDNQIIENLEIHGGIVIIHNNVTIRNCDIYGDSSKWIVVNAYVVGYHTYNLLIEDCKIDGNGVTTGAVNGRNFTIRRCEVLHAAQAIKVVNGTAVIENNYIHDLWGHTPDSHNAAIGTNGETDRTDAMNITVRNNNIIAYTTDGMGGTSGAICLWGDFGPISNWQIEHNRVASDSWYIITAGCTDKPFGKGSNIRVINNVLVYKKTIKGKTYFLGGRNDGIVFYQEVRGNYASGNIWEDTGEPVLPRK